MFEHDGLRLLIDRALLAEVGEVEVDYLAGPLRRGFRIRAARQGAGPDGGCR